MLLKIILLFVLFKMAYDLFYVKEGLMSIDPPGLASVGKKEKESSCNVNIKLPKYDYDKKIYINDNDYIFNNFQNIKKYADIDNC